ncbi:MAG: diaminopimelate decarboxylase [Deltaproteobacteria bacterium]|nr:diaminopimelate decarboxylase [Deltaproteobacteria bacterium]
MPYPWPHTQGILTIGGQTVDRLAAQFDTPLYVTDAAVIRERYRTLTTALAPAAPVQLAYACKANTNLAIMQLLAREGAAIDAVSPGEVMAARRIGVPPERIMFTGTNPRDDELAWMAAQGIWINCDAVSVARRVAALCAAPREFSVRINPDVGAGHHDHVVTGGAHTQFGVHPDELTAICDLFHARGHRLARLHAHVGSGVPIAEPFLKLIDALGAVRRSVKDHPAAAIETIDIGGGIGIPYRPGESALEPASFGRAIATKFRATFGPTITLMMEPGRFFVAESTILLTRITTIKTTDHATFLGVDAGFNVLLRPILYNAYHHIIAPTKMDQPPSETYAICGPICETGDILARDRKLPPMREGELLAICDAGAYGFAMASTYNSRPRPAEVMIRDGKAQLIRRRETMDDLFAAQHPLR